MDRLATQYLEQGRITDAEPLLAQVLNTERRVLGMEHPDTLGAIDELGTLYLNQGRYRRAEALFREALNWHQKAKSDGWTRFECEHLLGASLMGQKNYAAAEPL